MAKKYNIPDDIELLKSDIINLINPISPISDNTKAEKNFLFSNQKTDASQNLPAYYLCYFLFVELLGYKNLGKFEKSAWTVPIDYKGIAYLIEHRKFGIGLFAHDKVSQEEEAEEIVKLINKAVRLAKLYFEWLANEAAAKSNLNVFNYNWRLFDRFSYFQEEYNQKIEESRLCKGERVVIDHGNGAKSISIPSFEIQGNAKWLALAAIEAFFSWTEHIFIHAAILKGKITTGEDVADLADNEWAEKFKAALDTTNPEIRKYYDQLVVIKRQIRNFVAHGAFGKNGEAFQIHSGAGAVPLLMPHQKGNGRFAFKSDLDFDESDAMKVIDGFISLYWLSDKYPEVAYIKSDLPSILPMAKDGTYKSAMNSFETMSEFVNHLSRLHDNAGNMDW